MKIYSFRSSGRKVILMIFVTVLTGSIAFGVHMLRIKVDKISREKVNTSVDLQKAIEELQNFQKTDQVVLNKNLQEEIKNINETFKKSISLYENLFDLGNNSKKFETNFANILSLLANRKYEDAKTQIDKLGADLKAELAKVAAVVSVTTPAVLDNTPPSTGYSYQQVQTDSGAFTISMIAGDLSSTKIIVDTASDSDCSNNCPVLPLATYVSRNNAYAGVNGSYFCPASYPTCAGKTNTFDLLVMNKNKTYFNSANNMYSSNPGVIFGGGYIRFVSSVSQWGRDTGIDSMISNFPLLVEGGNIRVSGSDDPKQSGRGNRSFVANRGNTVYIGVAYNVSVAESAKVMKALSMENALNLDSGGSTALWSGGYKAGPGRDIPNAILFIKK